MQHKYRLNVSILLMSSLLIQNVNAREDSSNYFDQLLKRNLLKNLFHGQTLVDSTHTTSWGISQNTKIKKGGIEIVQNSGISSNATIHKGGKQLVTNQGKAIETKIEGGSQFIFNQDSSTRTFRNSSAYDAVVSGKDGIWGQQNVYDGGEAWNTKVMKDGEQNIYKVRTKKGGVLHKLKYLKMVGNTFWRKARPTTLF
ncbi:hypothetical protein [Bartonella schoenbuchensis]|uniref:Autotransporter passenger strand-loop-strand repeat-containing protein n=1 Tax=Bartonella schoenbuchensis (strain DSM 13525 / NCTC 13165 / R1) TaxID=687861 RepID=A0A1S6XPE6_BARSR|nr:autotransporter passenger strand-loop-strand repeat-containing protein [Bartonella schoenbuchensis R1]